jgi:hypothetical protein
VYVNRATVVTEDGNLKLDSLSVRPFREGYIANAGAEEVWRKEMAWSETAFDEVEWKKEIESAGLKSKFIHTGTIQW